MTTSMDESAVEALAQNYSDDPYLQSAVIYGWNAAQPAQPAACELNETVLDWDGTDAAHPAWWRGNDAGVEAVVRIANKVLDGLDDLAGVSGSPSLNALRHRLAALATATRGGQGAGPLSVEPGQIDDAAVRDDALYKLLCSGSATPEDQRYAAGWIARLTASPTPEQGNGSPPFAAVDARTEPKRRIYLDLDGVMADFDAHFPATFGLDHRSLADDAMWHTINAHPSYFRDMSPCPGAIEFFRSIEHLRPIILTACPRTNYAHVAKQKREWVREHLSKHVTVLPVMGGRNKPLFMQEPGDILIDDWAKNIDAWISAGGVGILHSSFDETRAVLTAPSELAKRGRDQ